MVSVPPSTAAPVLDTNAATQKTLLSIRNVAKHFGQNIVLRNISLDIAEGEFLTILGESGSGKTTLLRIVAGFERATSGEVWMGDERLDQQPPYRRRVNTVFQHYALFPHLTVEENVEYGLRVAKRPVAEIKTRVEEALAKVKMTAYAKVKPSKISGGQQQRIALARALVNRPKLLLLDEPLSALDANLRRQMQLELKSLQREVAISFLFVTHDQEEAMVMSDRIALSSLFCVQGSWNRWRRQERYTAARQPHTSRNSSDTRIYWKLKCEAGSRASPRYRGQSRLRMGRPYSLCDRRIFESSLL